MEPTVSSSQFTEDPNQQKQENSKKQEEPSLTEKEIFIESFVPLIINAGDSVRLKVYPDCRPQNLEIAPLQKGIVLMLNDLELIEEGAGFGVPIVKYSDYTFFSSSAKLYFEKNGANSVFKKVFSVDSISKKRVHNAKISYGLYSFFHSVFERIYLNRTSFRFILDGVMRVRHIVGVHTEFIRMQPRGEIVITYHFFPNLIKVNVDLSKLDSTNCREILLLNEQGASHFRTYTDNDGVHLCDREIEAWTRVTAGQATFSSDDIGVSFSLNNVKGVSLFRGREKIKDRFCWAGMTYALESKIRSFEYFVKLSRFSRFHTD